MKPTVWTIAGSDPSGGAGIQADLKVFDRLGTYGCSVISALTAQNTLTVSNVQPIEPGLLRDQLFTLIEDLPPAVIKIGMIGSIANIRILSKFLNAFKSPFVICDPVLASSSGTPLLDYEALIEFKRELLPCVDLLTPNLPEAEMLTGSESAAEAAGTLLRLGTRAVLIKGGHSGAENCRDFLTDGRLEEWIEGPRIGTRCTHGTGCALSAAIAAFKAKELETFEAVRKAKLFLTDNLREANNPGSGHPSCLS